MEPVAGAVEAGISSAAVVAESVMTVAATTAAKTAEAGLAGAAQAGAAATEGAVQTAGVAAETGGEAMLGVAEAAPGVVETGAESLVQEGLAVRAQTTLEASGPDAALNSIVSGPPVLENQGIDTASTTVPGAGEPAGEVSLAEGTDQAGVAEDAAVSPIQEGARPSAHTEQTPVQTDSDISDEIRRDPLFQQKLEEERAAAQERGEPIDEQKLSQEALANYNQDKQAEQQQLTPEQQKIQQLEQKINGLVAENTELRNNIAQINEALGGMKDVLILLTQTMAEKEQDPKKKESLIALLAKIAAIIVLGAVIEGGKTAAPPLGSPTG
ncbi:MAG: hypothetical protein AABX72_01255, partial [Nanoarchaeota archaeon]|mgnify:CR=1